MKTKAELTEYKLLQDLPRSILTNPHLKNEFKALFQERVPSMYADIESLFANPNCSCAAKVRNYAIENKEEVAGVIFDFFTSKDAAIEAYLSDFEKTVSATLSGKVLKTTIDKWGLFYEEIKRHNFKSFSVAKEGEDLFVFFL